MHRQANRWTAGELNVTENMEESGAEREPGLLLLIILVDELARASWINNPPTQNHDPQWM